MTDFDKIKIIVRKYDKQTELEPEAVPISGEALEALLKFDESPLDAILIAIKMAIVLRNRYGTSFEVLNKQKGQRATDIYDWEKLK